MNTLRGYQEEFVDRVRDAVREGYKNILIVAPTAAGKTVIATHIVRHASLKGNRVAFVVDRKSLIHQTSEMFTDAGIAHGVIQADHGLNHPDRLVQICSQQTIARRRWPAASLIIVDEAHTITRTVSDRIAPRDTVAIGLTATPFSKGLGKLYDKVINVTTTNQLIAEGYLSNYRIFAPSEPDMTGVKVTGGEWESNEASKRALQVVGDCVAEYLKRGDGRKFICSAVDLNHVEALQRAFMAAGISCATYTYKDRDEDRTDTVDEFRRPDSKIRGLVTVTAASKGFNIPDIGVVIMARPLRKSLTEHVQFLGRGLRTAEGKEECLVLDHSGNTRRFWDECNEFFETGAVSLDDGKLKSKKKRAAELVEREPMLCPCCHFVHAPAAHCPDCGHEYPPRRAVEHVPGTLSELLASGDRSAVNRDIWPQICRYARDHRDDPAIAKKMALSLFKSVTGNFPLFRFETTEPAPVTIEVARRITSSNIRYRKSQQAQKDVCFKGVSRA